MADTKTPEEIKAAADAKAKAAVGAKASKFGPPHANYTGKVYNPETKKFVSYVKGHKVGAPK